MIWNKQIICVCAYRKLELLPFLFRYLKTEYKCWVLRFLNLTLFFINWPSINLRPIVVTTVFYILYTPIKHKHLLLKCQVPAKIDIVELSTNQVSFSDLKLWSRKWNFLFNLFYTNIPITRCILSQLIKHFFSLFCKCFS